MELVLNLSNALKLYIYTSFKYKSMEEYADIPYIYTYSMYNTKALKLISNVPI